VRNPQKIDTKALKQRILATTPSTDILHIATLINSAMIPLYNHFLVVLKTTEEDLAPLQRNPNFPPASHIWNRSEKTVRGSKWLSASFDKGTAVSAPQGSSRRPTAQHCFKMS
jgi:hypothetical protein